MTGHPISYSAFIDNGVTNAPAPGINLPARRRFYPLAPLSLVFAFPLPYFIERKNRRATGYHPHGLLGRLHPCHAVPGTLKWGGAPSLIRLDISSAEPLLNRKTAEICTALND